MAKVTTIAANEPSHIGYIGVLLLAWTIADLGGHRVPDAGDVTEALFFRTGRSDSWAA